MRRLVFPSSYLSQKQNNLSFGKCGDPDHKVIQRQITKNPQATGRTALAITEVFVGLSAVTGGLTLAFGVIDPLMYMPHEWLYGTPFSSYMVPGLVLAVVVGGGYTGAIFLLLRRGGSAALGAVVAGLILIIWLCQNGQL